MLTRVLGTPFHEALAQFSPDARWLAYTSNESGRDQTYVEPYPQTGRRWLISAGGGREPIWARDGKAIHYRTPAGDQLFRVAVSFSPSFTIGKPSLLIDGPFEGGSGSGAGANYDVAKDGRRFVMIERNEVPAPRQIVLIVNWLEELRRRVPRGAVAAEAK